MSSVPVLYRLQSDGLGIEVAEVVMNKGDEPDFVAGLLDSDLLAGKDGAYVDLPAFVTDATDSSCPPMACARRYRRSRPRSCQVNRVARTCKVLTGSLLADTAQGHASGIFVDALDT